uniref:Uncharacterized protein n=1 Tax=Amphimedon queenslandica TaxID=400682 RepID=A0A1X7V8L1_AMPQE
MAKLIGSSLKVTLTCTAGHVTQWSSSDPHYDKKNSAINENDILFAASILFFGKSLCKDFSVLFYPGSCMYHRSMFYCYQKLYLIPTVEKFWTQHITNIKKKFAYKELIASGDGMVSETGEVVELQTVDKREVNFKSPLMECEGLKRCLDKIATNSTMKVTELPTDASITVMAMMRDKYPSIVHSLDVWHKAKKLKKTLSQAAEKKGHDKINMWSDQICNHFWYCRKECNGDSMWISVLHHVQNEHVRILKKCDHILNDGTDTSTEPPTDCDGTLIPYFLPNELAMETLCQILLKFNVRFGILAILSVFSLMLAYCPKRNAFKDEAFRARMYLAAIDHNFHLGRNLSRNVSGEERNHRVYRKCTNRWDVPVFEQKSYDYMPVLIDTLYKYRADCDASIRSTVIKRYNHPEKVSATLSKQKPPSIGELAKLKKVVSQNNHNNNDIHNFIYIDF